MARACSCSAFVHPPLPTSFRGMVPSRLSGEIIDAEIVSDDKDDGSGGDDSSQVTKSIADLALDEAPEWKRIVVEFVERTPSNNLNVLPCRMPFTVDLDGTTYSVGVPFEDTVAIVSDSIDPETGEISQVVIDPDDEGSDEVLQLAATALKENMGGKILLRRTPRVLTVQGDLSALTGKYLRKSSDVSKEQLLKDDDEDNAFFDDFFKDALGGGYEEEFVLDDLDGDEAEKLLSMFSVPGLGTEEDNVDAIREMFGEDTSEGEAIGASTGTLPDRDLQTTRDGTKALPLFPFTSPDGKSHALVQLQQNPLLVGREDPDIDETQRMLLDAAESAEILPRIEEMFAGKLREAGLLLGEDKSGP